MAETASNSDQVRRNILLGKNSEVFSLLQGLNPCLWVDNDKSTLLHYAVQYENKVLVKKLIDLKANINAQNNKGETPLMLGVRYKNAELVYILLENNADMCVPNAQGKCLLGRALNDCDQDIDNTIRKLLLDYMTKENVCKSPYIRTKIFHEDCPLYYYKLLKNYNLTKILLQSGSPVNATNPFSKRTAIHEAAKRLDVEIVKLLTEYNANVNAEDFYKKSPVALICDYDEDEQMLEVVKLLINAGADLINNYFIRKLSGGSKEFVRMIFESDANLYVEDEDAKMLIEYVFENKNSDVVEELKKFRINLNVRSSDKKSLLHHAAAKGNTSLVRFLLDQGANVNAKDCYNLTPLHLAVDPIVAYRDRKSVGNWRNRMNCITLLLDNGADPQIFTKRVDYSRHRVGIFHLYLPAKKVIPELWTPAAICLALDEASGRKIEQSISEIEKYPELKIIFDSNKKLLDEMRKVKIDDSVSLLDFLTVKRIAMYAQNDVIITNLRKIIKEYNSDSFYHRRLHQRFFQLNQVIAVNEIFVKYYNVLAVDIAEKIVNYL